MRQRRYQPWSLDPLTDDARPLLGTCSRTAAQRILAAYNRRADCDRILVFRPIDVDVASPHVYACRAWFAKSGRTANRDIVAADVGAAFRQMLVRFGSTINRVGIWLFPAERDAGEPPIFEAVHRGRYWSARRAAS